MNELGLLHFDKWELSVFICLAVIFLNEQQEESKADERNLGCYQDRVAHLLREQLLKTPGS